jgi:hypothetical protein
MVFADVPGERARKNHATPYGGRGFFSAYRGLYRLHPPQRATLLPLAAGPTAGGFSPDGEGRGEGAMAPGGPPLKPGKNKRGRPEVMTGLVPAISARLLIGFSRGVQNVYQSKAVLLAAVLRTFGGLRPAPCLVSGCFHAQGRRSDGHLTSVPVPSGCCLPCLQRQHQMQVLRL